MPATLRHRIERVTYELRALARRHPVPFALAATAAVTAVLLPARGMLDKAQWGLLYLALTVALAGFGGRAAALVAAIASFAAWNFFFIPPLYTFVVDDPRDIVALVVFLVTAIAAGLATARRRRREEEAWRREAEAQVLARLSGTLLGAASPAEMAESVLDGVAEALSPADSAVLLATEGTLEIVSARPSLAAFRVPAHVLSAAEEISGCKGAPVASVTRARAEEGELLVLPVGDDFGDAGVLYVGPPSRRGTYTTQQRHLAQAVANLSSAYLRHERLKQTATEAEALRATDRMKSSFVASVSHELKTPLASVLATLTGLLETDPAAWEDRSRVKGELEAAVRSLGRLKGNITDLLDISRLEGDAWRYSPASFEVGEVIGSVLAAFEGEDRGRLRLEVQEGMPPMLLDFRQMSRAVGALVENALAYSAPGEPVTVGARVMGESLLIWAQDRGPGVRAEERSLVFEKFYRSPAVAGDRPSTGLGLAIVKEIATAHGGRVWVEDAKPDGALFVISIPVRTEEGG